MKDGRRQPPLNSLWRDQTVSSSLRAFSFADDILSSAPAPVVARARSLGHHSICQSRARPCLHSSSALEGQTVQWSNGRHTMTCGQRRTVVLSDDRCPPDRWQNQRRPRPSPIERLPPPFPRSPLRLVPRTIGDFPLMTGVKLFPLLRPRCGQKSSILKQSP